jgi:hypothetical protein
MVKRMFVSFALILSLAATGPEPLRVLFIGNSYTYINDLPQLTTRLAASAKPPRALQATFVGEGGATLKRHWEAGNALDAIRKGKWDYVVLQDQGTLGSSSYGDGIPQINDPKMFHTYARLFDAEIRNAGAKTIFFMTWARQDSPQSQAALTNAYESIAAERKALLAPVGVAWQNALHDNPKLALHDADRSHPAPAGTYLAACVFYAVFFSSSPQGLSGEGLTDGDAAFLQRVAWQTVHAGVRMKTINTAVDPSSATAEPATPAALERGRAILAEAQRAAGGVERLRAIRDISVTLSGRILAPGGAAIPFDARDTFVFPATQRTEQRFPFGELVTFLDGNDGWRKSPQGLQDPLPDHVKKPFRAQVVRNTFKLLRAEGEVSAQFEKRDRVGERDADVILISTEGESARLFVGSSSGALLKKTYRGIGTGGPADIEETYSDYRQIAGLEVPFRIDLTQNGAPFVEVTIREVKFNSGVDRNELAKKPQ